MPSKFQFLLVAALILTALFTGMEALELRAEEPRRAVVAMEMTLSGNYVVPTIHGCPYYNKPPLFNWILVAFLRIFGSFDEWVVRLPGLLSFLATAVFYYFFVKKWIDTRTALFSSLFFLTAADLLFYGAVNSGEIDLFLVFVLYLQACLTFHFFQKQQFLLLFGASYLLTAAAFLTKGLPAVVFQGFTLIGWFVYARRWKMLFGWQHAVGALAFLLPVAAYFFAYAKYQPALPYLVNLLKDATQKSALESGVLDIFLNLLKFPLNFVLILLPWSLLGYYCWRKDFFKLLKTNTLLQFFTVFALANIWIYWISPDSRNRYLYPFFPPVLVILTWFGLRFSKWKTEQWLWVVALLATVRIVYNFTLMPLQQEKLNSGLIYRNHTEAMLKITGDEPVFLTGEPVTQLAAPSVGPFQLQKITLTTPPLVPYQLPYYLTKANGHTMQFESSPKPGRYYLAFLDFAEKQQTTIFYRFREKWMNREMVLLKVAE